MSIKRFHTIMPIWLLIIITASLAISVFLEKKGNKMTFITNIEVFNNQNLTINIKNYNLKTKDVVWVRKSNEIRNYLDTKALTLLNLEKSGIFYSNGTEVVAPKAKRHFEESTYQYILDLKEPFQPLEGNIKLFLILKDLDKTTITLNGDTILQQKIYP